MLTKEIDAKFEEMALNSKLNLPLKNMLAEVGAMIGKCIVKVFGCDNFSFVILSSKASFCLFV